jgi:hypothetical protein
MSTTDALATTGEAAQARKTDYTVPYPCNQVDNSSRESTATLPDNLALPTYHGENVGDKSLGEATTSAKRKRSGEHSPDKRQKLLHKGLYYNTLDFIAFLIDEKYVTHVSLALYETVITLTAPGEIRTHRSDWRYYIFGVFQSEVPRLYCCRN